ncbi:PQQ-dependent sugar dehydrogenase [Aestuariispira ectoiniformans]|uniref:PQQ-dependent sugar dehydrogenase n=1 Tax=Aestuariispira ectoiniformans TaxID=2775080 RepID=UPI00223BC5D6|nr:PQQ-dependent sugar dehydrogenase [Aestuariispira ectoiniformans]
MTKAGFIGLAFVTALAAAATARADQPGTVYHIRPDNLPKPYATSSAVNPSTRTYRPEGIPLKVTSGFQVNLFAEDLTHPRNILAASDGTVFLAESKADKITILKDRDGDGHTDYSGSYVTGANRPHGLALHAGYLYFADLDGIWRIAWQPGSMKPSTAPKMISQEDALGGTGGHWTRNIAFSPDGNWLYASIGSRSNIGEEPIPRASIQRFKVHPDGRVSSRQTFAYGLRNPVGIAFKPGTNDLYTVVNERDGMGDGLVPDYFTHVQDGGFYGWPYAYIGSHPMPGYSDKRPDLVKEAIIPDVLFEAHSASLGFTFLDKADVPEDWKDDALVALHGSWNAARATGYKVVRVPFEDGKPTGEYIDFLTGFRLNPGKPGQAAVWGRPVALTVMPDGSILVSDDAGGTIWRISRK